MSLTTRDRSTTGPYRLGLLLRVWLGLESLAALAGIVFGAFLAIAGKGAFDLRPVGWAFIAAGLGLGALDVAALFAGRRALLLRTAFALPATLTGGWWAVAYPDPLTSGVFLSNLAVFVLAFRQLRNQV